MLSHGKQEHLLCHLNKWHSPSQCSHWYSRALPKKQNLHWPLHSSPCFLFFIFFPFLSRGSIYHNRDWSTSVKLIKFCLAFSRNRIVFSLVSMTSSIGCCSQGYTLKTKQKRAQWNSYGARRGKKSVSKRWRGLAAFTGHYASAKGFCKPDQIRRAQCKFWGFIPKRMKIDFIPPSPLLTSFCGAGSVR